MINNSKNKVEFNYWPYILLFISIITTVILDLMDNVITWLITLKLLFFTPLWLLLIQESFYKLSNKRFLVAFFIFWVLFTFTSPLIGVPDEGYFSASFGVRVLWNLVSFLVLIFIVESENKKNDGRWGVIFAFVFLILYYLLELLFLRFFEPNGFKWFLFVDFLLLYFTLFIDFSNWYRYKRKK